eukprot:3702230-Prymnesium_polylepis.1
MDESSRFLWIHTFAFALVIAYLIRLRKLAKEAAEHDDRSRITTADYVRSAAARTAAFVHARLPLLPPAVSSNRRLCAHAPPSPTSCWDSNHGHFSRVPPRVPPLRLQPRPFAPTAV